MGLPVGELPARKRSVTRWVLSPYRISAEGTVGDLFPEPPSGVVKPDRPRRAGTHSALSTEHLHATALAASRTQPAGQGAPHAASGSPRSGRQGDRPGARVHESVVGIAIARRQSWRGMSWPVSSACLPGDTSRRGVLVEGVCVSRETRTVMSIRHRKPVGRVRISVLDVAPFDDERTIRH